MASQMVRHWIACSTRRNNGLFLAHGNPWITEPSKQQRVAQVAARRFHSRTLWNPAEPPHPRWQSRTGSERRDSLRVQVVKYALFPATGVDESQGTHGAGSMETDGEGARIPGPAHRQPAAPGSRSLTPTGGMTSTIFMHAPFQPPGWPGAGPLAWRTSRTPSRDRRRENAEASPWALARQDGAELRIQEIAEFKAEGRPLRKLTGLADPAPKCWLKETASLSPHEHREVLDGGRPARPHSSTISRSAARRSRSSSAVTDSRAGIRCAATGAFANVRRISVPAGREVGKTARRIGCRW